MKQQDEIALPVASGNRLIIKKDKLEQLAKQFPMVHVHEELKALQQTLEEYPEFVRCRSGTPAFYTEWLESIQKRRERHQRLI